MALLKPEAAVVSAAPSTRATSGHQTYTFSSGTAEIVARKDLINCPAWRQTFRDECKDYRYYEIIEETLDNDFEFRYLLLRDSTGTVRAIQPFLFVRQNLVEGIPGTLRRIIDLLRKKAPRLLTMRLLMVGCAAGEGRLGNIEPSDQPWLVNALAECLPGIARRGKASLAVLKDFSAKYRVVLAPLTRAGFARVPSMPMTRLPLTFRDFDDYLAQLSYATRKSLRRKFRKTERMAKIELEITNEIEPYVAEAYPLYLAVHERSPMKFEKLTPAYLCELGKRMPERVRFFIWRIKNRIIAFSVCLVCGETIYDEYLGLDYDVAYDLQLYFYTFRDIISWAITNRLKLYCSSPLNYDPKLHLGCELLPLDLYISHTRPVLNPFFSRFVKLLEPTRHDPILPRFSNAAELYD